MNKTKVWHKRTILFYKKEKCLFHTEKRKTKITFFLLLILYFQKQSTFHQELSLLLDLCVLSLRKWNSDRPLQNSHLMLPASLADLPQLGWVEPLDWHSQDNADLHMLKQFSPTPSRTITEVHSCHPEKCADMYPIQTSRAWRDSKALKRIVFWHKTNSWLLAKWPSAVSVQERKRGKPK